MEKAKRREYISWSQLQLFEKSPEQYRDVYILGQDILVTRRILLGREVADRMAEEGEAMDEDINFLKVFLPDYPEKEFPIEADLEGIKLLGKLDGFNPKKLVIGELKTGAKWTQKMADKHGQLTFYALLVWLKYGKLPKIFLHWAETAEDDFGEIYLTRRIVTFKTKRTLAQVILFSSRIRKANKGIKDLWKQEKHG